MTNSSLNLDQNATTSVHPEVMAAMLPYFLVKSGNPSSRCYDSKRLREDLEIARGQVAALIGAEAEEIVFTSGGTEANASLFWQMAGQSGICLASETEHSSVVQNGEAFLGPDCFRLLPVDGQGQIDEHAYQKALRNRPAVVSLHAANNETGAVLPVAELLEMARKAHAVTHTDAVQALGKIRVNVHEWNADFASFSAHKVQGPKGIGALWVRSGMNFKAFIRGGGQQSDRRSGTENVPGIIGFGTACGIALRDFEARITAMRAVRDAFESELLETVPDLVFHAREHERLPNTSSVRIPGVIAAEFLLMLDENGICASAGSACHSLSKEPSHVLLAMGLTERQAKETLRFSFGPEHGPEDASRAARTVARLAARYRG